MLYLNPPYWIINGISLFPDHADPLQYYFLPLMPHLTTRNESGVNVPQIQLTKYRGHSDNGGFLNCDVDLGITQELLDDTAAELKRQAKLDATPRLAAVPVIDGTVKMMLLGAQSTTPSDSSPKPTTSQPAEPPRFVVKIQGTGKPSLFGDENATFSVQLDQDGTTIVEKALQGELSPVGIVYSLDFLALRPAYSVRVNIDWNRVQKHLDESFSVDVLFFSSDVDKVVDQLIENRTIVIEADTFVPEGDDTKDIMARRDQALAEVRDMIKSTFFESSIQPPKPGEPDGWDKAATFANEISRIAVSGGASAFGGLSYKKVDITRIDHKTLNATFQERTTVRKTIWPQGHLGGLFGAVKGGLPLDRFIIPVDLDNPYFQRRQIEAISQADFEGDGLQSIDVTLNYGGQPRTVLLEPGAGKDRQSVDWTSILDNGTMVRPIEYSYRVTFKNVDRSQRPVTLDTTALPNKLLTVEDKLEIVPRDLLYSIANIPINTTAVAFPWDRYPQVDVECRYIDEASQVNQDQTFRLTQAAQNSTFRLFMRDPSRRQFEYRITYYGADGKDLPLPWTVSDDEQVIVRDPFPKVRQLVVVPQLSWSSVDRVFVDLSYQDGPNAEDEIVQSFEFNSKDNGSKTFSVNPKDPSQKLVSYEVTLLLINGTTVKVPRSYTADRRLIVRADMRGHRIISIAPAAGSFAKTHVSSLIMDIRYVDGSDGLSFSDNFTFKSPEDNAIFEFDYVDETKNHYEYKVTTNYDNGLSRDGDWMTDATDTLLVPVA